MDGNNPEVLIVGAGPVGIVLACELLQQGVPIRIVDSLPAVDESDPHSKGILIWPRSLELLRRIGASEQMSAAGHHSPGVGYYSSGRLLGTARLDKHPDTPYNFVLTLPQRETERVLRARFAELGGFVERGVTLEHLDNDGPLPVVRLRHPDGDVETVRPSWLIGADGPGSTTRTMLGLRFEGEPIDVTYAIGDAPITGQVPTNAAYYYSPDGVVALVPLGDGVYRIAANIPHRTEADGNPPRELLEAVIRRRAKIDIRVQEPLWTRSFRPRLGMTERFRSGRCFLAGDSAHVISPAGGQGMNVGFQDAANLGWKLAAVVTGRLDESVLDTYEPERLTGALRMSGTSAAQAKFALQRKPLRILRRDAIFLAARLTGVLHRVLVPLLSQTDSIYGDPDSRPVILRGRGRSPIGARLPLFAPPALSDGTPPLDLYRYTVALWPGRRTPVEWAVLVRTARDRIGEAAHVLDLAGLPAGPAAKLRRHLGSAPVIATIRPDGHLAHLSAVDAPADARAFLDAAAPAPRTGAGAQIPAPAAQQPQVVGAPGS